MGKKRKARRKSAKKRTTRRPRAKVDSALPLPDRRLIEASMAELLGDETEEDNALRQAQELVYDAWDTPDVEQRVQLATQALSICPDCADAYVLLGEHAPRDEDALKYYEQGVAAGERALGEECFAEYAGHFWGVFATRPYMRARMGLAVTLRRLGRREEAVDHYQELLRLNPGDNQGVRYVLAVALLDLNRDDQLDGLLDAYPDDGMADWSYNRALLRFRREGDSPRARDQLLEAVRENAHVPPFLLGDRMLPAEPPPYVAWGEESEAVSYVGAAIGVWHATAGALSWLRQTAKVRLSDDDTSPTAVWKRQKDELMELPQLSGHVWLADVGRLPEETRKPGQKKRPWGAIVIDPLTQDVRMFHAADRKPTPAKLLELLSDAMLEPLSGELGRPECVQFRTRQYLRKCQPRLKEIGVEASLSEDL